MKLKINIKPLFVACLMTATSSPLLAEGLVGIPSQLSGTKSAPVESIADSPNARKLGGYIKEQAENSVANAPRPAVERYTPNPPVKPYVAGDINPPPQVNESGAEANNSAAPAPRKTQVRFIVPTGMNLIEKDIDGAATIDGDKVGTYLVKVPPLLFSRITLPFHAQVSTPFPDHVEIIQTEGVVLVAPKSAMPINLVLYHPKKPDISVGLVLVPDGQEIPASVEVLFDPVRLPVETKDTATGETKIDGVGIITRIHNPDNKTALKFERSNDHISTLENMHKLVSQGLVPDGFSLEVVTENAVGALCGDRRLIGEFTQRMRGDRYTIDVFSVANADNDYVVFDEQNCYRRGVASVQFFPSRSLAPAKTAELIIIHANDVLVEPTQQRRPTSVRLDR